MYKEKIVNIETGEETFRNYTKDEIVMVEANIEKAKMENLANEEKINQKLALFEKLGISLDEAKLLFS